MSKYRSFAVDVPVRFSDLDAYGHVNNALFFTYLEHARVSILGGSFNPHMSDKPVFLVRSASCEYNRPIPLVAKVRVEVDVLKMKRTSVTLGYRISDGAGTDFATAETVLVSYDPVAARPTAIPEWFLEVVSER